MAKSSIDAKILESEIRNLNYAYRRGEPKVTDKEFDEKVELLREINPDADWFKKGVQDEVESRKEKLPIPMYSLEKIKSYEEFKKWAESCDYMPYDILIITPKYDGISLCVNEIVGDAWTRGDGEYGQNCANHFEKMRNSDWRVEDPDKGPTFSFGEAIFSTPTFLKLKQKTKYKSARNAVAGLINSPTVSENVSEITYVRYGCDKEEWNKEKQLDFLNKAGISGVPYIKVPFDSLIQNEETFVSEVNRMFEQLSQGYKCDGLVIEFNESDMRQRLGRLPNNNPKYAIAYKNPDWSEREETMIKSIDWQISKDGRLAPVVNVEPVELCGATVSRCSAYNARYVQDNFLSKGARIIIARSGDVIPKHLKTVRSYGAFGSILPSECPICGEPIAWDSNKVDLVCSNVTCDGILLARCVYFFSVLDFKEFREPTIKKLFEVGHRYPWQMFNLTLEDLQKIEGLGNVAAKVLSKQFEELRKKGTNFAKLLSALNLFKGTLAEKTCQKILDGLKLYNKTDVDDFIEHTAEDTAFVIVEEIEGIGGASAYAFVNGLMTWYNFGTNIVNIPITYYGLEEKSFDGQMTVVFTGFRDKELEKKLTDLGHKVGASVSKKTTCLVVKEKGSGSSKEIKAEQLGTPIMTVQEFKEKVFG